MASLAAPGALAVVEASESLYQLEVAKLHILPTEQQDLYLLTFVSDLVRHVTSLEPEETTAQQGAIKKQLLQLISLGSPASTRVIRNGAGKCFAHIFARGDRKTLYESLNELVALVEKKPDKGDKDKEKDGKVKHAAVHCIGAVFEAAGDSAISLSSLACAAILRQLKAAQNHAGFRSSIFLALGDIVAGIGASADEITTRDVWKAARNVITGDKEKSFMVQRSACKCLEQLTRSTSYFDNSNDFDNLGYAAWKAMDSKAVMVRHAAASCLSTILFKTYVETTNKQAPQVTKKSKKSKRPELKGEERDEEMERPVSPAPSKLLMSLSYRLPEILRLLGDQYCRPSNSNRVRAGIAVTYAKLFTKLGAGMMATKYSEVAHHLLYDILGTPAIKGNRYRILISRKFVQVVLDQSVHHTLSESAQINAIRFLVNDVLRDYPAAVPERPEPAKEVILGALGALSSLLVRLGSAASGLGDSTREALLQVCQHPSYTVQIHVARCLQAFITSCPAQLLPTTSICLNSLNRELSLLGGQRQSPKRCTGYAYSLAALLSLSSQHPLYASVDVYSRVLSIATSLLRSSSAAKDLRISSCQIQVAWTLLGGLMTLGPRFVKSHLSQLLLLWKNALSRPLQSDNTSQRTLLELSFLSHVRESALRCLLIFLQYNRKLVTGDVSRRISNSLANTGYFLASLPEKKSTEEFSQRLSPGLQLADYDAMVRRQMFMCNTLLLFSNPSVGSDLAVQGGLLPLCIAAFADPENYGLSSGPTSLGASIANSTGAFEGMWDAGDQCGFGVTGRLRGLDIVGDKKHWTTVTDIRTDIDRTLLSPACGAWEHDAASAYAPHGPNSQAAPMPFSGQVVDTAIELFATLLPYQTPRVQESALEQIASNLASTSLSRNPTRKAAMSANVGLALYIMLKKHDRVKTVPVTQSATVEQSMVDILRTLIVDQDPYIRHVAASALGLLCSNSGSALTIGEVNFLIDLVVRNREPSVRAGCALALASIQSERGSAGFQTLKDITGVLMSLATDPHPTVHFWALESLSRVAESAGLTFGPYISSSIGILGQLLMSDSHNAESSSLASSNIELEQPASTIAVLARLGGALIDVLGPDLQDPSQAKVRDMILTLIRHFQAESRQDILVAKESMHSQEHLNLYAPSHMNFGAYIQMLQANLDSASTEVRDVALEALNNSTRRDAEEVIRTAAPGLEDRLWDVLNSDPSQPAVKASFMNWLQQKALSDTRAWLARCTTAMTKSKASTEHAPTTSRTVEAAGVDIQDEEVAGFNVAASATKDNEASESTSSQELMRWQVRRFVMDCLGELLDTVSKQSHAPAMLDLQARIGDVIRTAFSASTANVVELRIAGLRTIDQALKIFGRTPDPDFPEAFLLEQYQAQITSALMPAFASDSSPDLAAEAMNVCATFIATGMVTNVDRMGRILKLLVTSLQGLLHATPAAEETSQSEALVDSGTPTSQGITSKELGSTAGAMIKQAVLSAWASLQIASVDVEQDKRYLVEVLKPHLPTLTPLWLSSLKEYARLRFEPEGEGSSLDRDTLLTFYQATWLNYVDAIASLIDEDSEFVFDALDGRAGQSATNGIGRNDLKGGLNEINYRSEPAAFFFVLFGLVFEALTNRSSIQPSSTSSESLNERTLHLMLALKKILRPSVCGNAIYDPVVFGELIDLLDRLVSTETSDVKADVVEIARDLTLSHPSRREPLQTDRINGGGESLGDDIDQLFELTRIIVLVLAGHVPGLSDNNNAMQTPAVFSEDAVSLVRLSLSALVDAAAVFPSVIKADLHACLLHIFATILSTYGCQASVVPQILPIFRRFVSELSLDTREEATGQISATLARFLDIFQTAQNRENETALLFEKNSLLACTILVTSSPGAFNQHDMILSRFTSAVMSALGKITTTSVAAGCVRSLISMQYKGSTGPSVTAMLLPRLLAFLLGPVEGEGLAESRKAVAATLFAFVKSLGPEQRRAALPLFLSIHLSRAVKEGALIYQDIAARLLELASIDQGAFRIALLGMAADQKGFMELVIREGRSNTMAVEVGDREDREPTIALKMDF
ncbi:hypothetical protein LTR66_003198 [Elasticomyces elasticus]|nr:hypothetical protein LTR66_003198 [Elasticomyces elasticus]